MMQRIARLQGRLGRGFFSSIVVGALMIMFGPAVYAEFGRTTGPVGWGYGYGYGNSYGDGWDSGTQAGYMTTEIAFNTEEFRNFGYGYGRMLSHFENVGSISYDASTDTYDIDEADAGDIFEAGLAVPVESDTLEEASDFRMEANVRVHLGDHTILLHRDDYLFFDDSRDLTRLRATSDFPTTGLTAVRGQVTLGPSPHLDLPFAFEFYGEEKTRFRVSSNGFITFGDSDNSGCCEGQNMPDEDSPNDLIAGAWMDLVPEEGSFKYEVFGEAPNRVAVIEFNGVLEIGDAGVVTFQIHLHESDGTIEIHTGSLDVRNHQLTQGIENADGTHGTTVLDVVSEGENSEDDYLASEFAWRFTPGSPDYEAEEISYSPYPFSEAALDVAPPSDDTFFPVDDLLIFDNGSAEVAIFVGSTFNGQRLTIAQHDRNDFEAWDMGWGECTPTNGYCEFEVETFGYYVVRGAPGGTSSGGSSPEEPTGTVTLTYPVGGESIAGGSTRTVTWTTTGTIHRSRVLFSSDSGTIWSVVAEDVSGTSRSWSVPNISTTHGRIRVEGMNSAGGVVSVSASPSDFTITATSTGGGTSDNNIGSQGSENGSLDDRHGSSGDGAMSRGVANGRLPFDAQVDYLVKLPSDNNPATEVDSAVYYIGLDAKRHPFPTSRIFFSWYQDFRDVRPVSASTLASIPLGAPILVRPGTHWVKINSDPKTYFVEPGYTLRWIKDEVAARLLGGPDWNRNIVDVDVSLFTDFSSGPDITATALANDWPSGALVKATGAPDVYYVTTTGRRHLVSEAAMQANHFQMRFVTTTGPDAGWIHKAIEAMISGFEEALFSLMH